MNDQFSREKILDVISEMERLAEEIATTSRDFPALERNAKRIQASLLMMKLNLGESVLAIATRKQHYDI